MTSQVESVAQLLSLSDLTEKKNTVESEDGINQGMSAYTEWIGYKSQFFDDLDEFLHLHRTTLKTLVGEELLLVRVPWHSNWNRWDGGPIVLEFQAIRLELEGAWGQFSLAVGSLDMDASLPADIVWRYDIPDLQSERFVGSRVDVVNALSYDNGDKIAGLEFKFANGEILNIFENGNETGVSQGRIDSEYLFSVAFS